VAVPESRGLVFARADFDLSLRGRLQKAFFKVSRVTLDVVYCDGRTASYRVVPDTARNGLLLNGLADEEGGLARILERRPGDPVTLIRFSGPGLVAHRQPIPVTWAEVRGAADRTSVCVHTSGPALADLQRRKIPGGKPLMAIDDFEPETEEGHGGILRVRGWAVDPVAERPAAGLLVEVAGHVSWLPVGRKRPDVAAVFGVPAYSSSGYVGLVSLVGVPPGRHEVVFRVVTADGRGYYYDDRLRREVQVR
jgi:hypothetical protein